MKFSSCIQVRCPSLSLFTMDGRMLSWWSFPAVEIKKSLQESPQLYSCVVLVWGDVLGQVYITIQKKCSGVISSIRRSLFRGITKPSILFFHSSTGSNTEIILTVLCKLNLVSYIFEFFFETGLPYILSFYSSKVDLIRYEFPYLKQSPCGEWRKFWVDFNPTKAQKAHRISLTFDF